ncbi:MAG: type II secretion system protein [Planctomycetota bacterium]|jgi:prepilin-type N-terminal cleavage/methylation domain-containing protein/prepilin-type processing-associated H-X9-DG protein
MRRKNGFTLIELLVVIAIIALLMGILMPALSKARDLAMGAACRGNLKNYTLAIAMYTDDNDGKFCDAHKCYFSTLDRLPVETGVGGNHLHLRWCNGDIDLKSHPEYGGSLYPYIADARAFICPTYKRLAVQNSEDQFYQAYGATIQNYEPWYNYTMNAYVGSENTGVRESRVVKISEVKHPATTFSFTEESSRVDTAYNASGLNDTFMVPGNDSMVQGWLNQVGGNPRLVEPGPEGVGPFWDVIAGFHHAPSGNRLGGKGNCAFLDGHVSAHFRRETFFLSWPK